MTTPFDPEPSPEFNAQCTAIMDSWEKGDLSFRDSVAQLDALRNQAAQDHHPANQGRVELILGVIQGYRANLDASITHFERARMYFEQAGNRRRAIGAILNLGESYRWKGSFARARQYFRAAFDGAEAVGDRYTQGLSALNEGQMLLSMEQPESARRSIETARELIASMETSDAQREDLLSEASVALSQVYLLTGDLQQAWSNICDGMRRALVIAQPLQVGTAHRKMGEVLTALANATPEVSDFSTDPDEHFRAATEAFQEIKAEGELARTMYAHALSLAKRGRGMTAARKMQQAMIIFTRLGMNDDAAKAARAQIDVLARATSTVETIKIIDPDNPGQGDPTAAAT
ncbi:MAG: tetratricopeptide repeat protein [Anaerolineae bacterium]|nr:tetratricopeptide repeat protein [Anaerolineae bacterium]NUQ05230.1 tetratricopeptide repeat protein [Anaerolineae bacterium]